MGRPMTGWEDLMIGNHASRRDLLKGGSTIALSLTLGALAGPLAAQSERQMTAREKELYEGAKKEGELTWYTAHSDDVTAQALGRAFEAMYPGLKVHVVRTTAQVAFQRVSQEIKAGAMQVDVLSSTDIGHYVYLKEKSLLEKYVPENAGKLLDIYQGYDPDGFYFATSGGLVAMAHNTAKLPAAEAPKNWSDLTDPKWKDKISFGHPASAAMSAPGRSRCASCTAGSSSTSWPRTIRRSAARSTIPSPCSTPANASSPATRPPDRRSRARRRAIRWR
jgi:ABC-type thiamine transport system substrate-binding protein